MVWLDKSNSQVAEDPKSRYILLYEHLLIAQALLKSSDQTTRKQGFWVASESANFAAARLPQDKWLLARLYEGFLLPYISLANAQVWQDPSRQRVIEAAVSAFANSQERDREVAVLEWLISIGSQPKPPAPDALVLETNTLDWARGTLASVLFDSPNVTKADVERSLTLLQSIQSPEMTGFQHLKERVRTRLDEMQKSPDTNN